MVQLLFLILILSTAALLGNEFSIVVFIHPVLARTDHERFLPAIQVFAALFGKVMPFWMAATLVLHLALLGFSWRWPATSTVLLAAATLLWVQSLFSALLVRYPLNRGLIIHGWQNALASAESHALEPWDDVKPGRG